MLNNPAREAVYDEARECYRFYIRYLGHISMIQPEADESIGIHVPDVTEMERHTLLAEIWIPVKSPETSFPDRSLVYLKGRMVLPVLDIDSDDIILHYMIYIEVISARLQVQELYHGATSNLILHGGYIRPEVMIYGRVVGLFEEVFGFVTLSIESSEDVDGITEKAMIRCV